MDRGLPPSDAHPVPILRRTLTATSLHFSDAATQSEMLVQDPHRLALSYTQLMMGFLLFLPDPRAIAMVGLGGGSLAKFMHRHLPDAQLDVVEINPHVIALRDAFGVPPDDARLRVHQADGAAFLRAPPRAYDALLVDAFDAGGQPPALATAAFIDDCARSLAPEGVLVLNLHTGAPGHAEHLARLHQRFDDGLLCVPDDEPGNVVVFASLEPLHPRLDPSALLRRHRQNRHAWADVLPAMTRLAKRAHAGRPAG